MAKFRGQEATLAINDAGAGSISVGILQNAEITVEYEIEELMGQSPKIEARQMTREAPTVTAEWASIDFTEIESSLFEDDGSGTMVLKDQAEPIKFDVKGTFKDTDGNTHELTAKNVVFDDMSFSFDNDTFVTTDISGEGDDLQIATNTSA